MTATVLSLTPAVSEAVRDAQAIERRLRADGHEWAPALAEARERIARLAREPPRAAPTAPGGRA